MTNGTGWIEISPANKFDLQGDPIDRLVLKIQDRLLSLLPPSQLIAHPSTSTFPGDVPLNAARVTQSNDLSTAPLLVYPVNLAMQEHVPTDG